MLLMAVAPVSQASPDQPVKTVRVFSNLPITMTQGTKGIQHTAGNFSIYYLVVRHKLSMNYVLLCRIDLIQTLYLLVCLVVTVCPAGTYGLNCGAPCSCLNGAPCSPVTGICNCTAGYYGTNCGTSKTCCVWYNKVMLAALSDFISPGL